MGVSVDKKTTANASAGPSAGATPPAQGQEPSVTRLGMSILDIRKLLGGFVNDKLRKGIALSDEEVDHLRQIIRFCCKVHVNAKPYIEHYQLIRAFRHVLRSSTLLPDYIPPQIHRLITSWERNEYNLGKDDLDPYDDSEASSGEEAEVSTDDDSDDDLDGDAMDVVGTTQRRTVITKARGLAMRGILIRRTINGTKVGPKTRTVDPHFKRSANVFGHNGLTVGDWWPYQICALRDGAHGSLMGGIAGTKDKGCYSVIISGGGGYEDRDLGDTVWYTGSGEPGTDGIQPLTNASQSLITSRYAKLPVRVIRTSKAEGPYRPSSGLRYDGLYDVKWHGLVPAAGDTQRWRFRLERRQDQPPIRREVPTKDELDTLH